MLQLSDPSSVDSGCTSGHSKAIWGRLLWPIDGVSKSGGPGPANGGLPRGIPVKQSHKAVLYSDAH